MSKAKKELKSVITFHRHRKTGYLYSFGFHPDRNPDEVKEQVKKWNENPEMKDEAYVLTKDDGIAFDLACCLDAVQDKLNSTDKIFDCLDSLSSEIDIVDAKLKDFYNAEENKLKYIQQKIAEEENNQ